ncbi:MAG: hypothetical protein LAP21_20095 [Acidobacteriia bacterium]|nr:hypothetical protein [Terriglobia bacterium]
MKNHWDLSGEAFERLLSWLSPDREKAGARYEEIRRKLIMLFTRRGCDEPEALADETINRVARAVEESRLSDYEGDPILYFYGVAKNVHLEWTRVRKIRPEDIPSFEPFASEQEFSCLDQCLLQIGNHSRDLITGYYQQSGREKIRIRQALADQLGIGMNSLRIQVWRIRNTLRECVLNCVHKTVAQ